MEHYASLQDLAASQRDRELRVRIWDNKNIIIRRNLSQHQGLATQVWDAWLRQELRRFNGFEPIIEVDDFSGHQEIKFFKENELADAVHFILQGEGAVETAS